MKNILILILVNLVISILLTLLMISGHTSQILHYFLINLLYSNCIGFSICFFLSVVKTSHFSLMLRIITAILLILVGGFIGGLVGTFLVETLLHVNINFLNARTLVFFLSISLVLGASAYTIFLIIHRMDTNRIKFWRERQARTEAELTSLRNRINPHFLFNTLNSLAGLVYSDQAKAEEMIGQLSELLRYNLMMTEKPLINLESELKAVEDYLQIEKIRLGERLKYQIKNEIEELMLPPLLLLTLVENAIKHGIAKNVAGGVVQIKLTENSEKFQLSVLNTGCELKEEFLESTGLTTLRELLKIQFLDKAEFTLTSTSDGTLAKVEISRGAMI